MIGFVVMGGFFLFSGQKISVDAIGARTLTLMNTYYPNLTITAAQTTAARGR